MPTVTVIMPMRNAEPFVQASALSILSQDVDLELIVVDDGSTDASPQIVQSIGDKRIRVIAGPRRGIAAAFNAGLAAANSPMVARCDSDDLFPLARLGRQAALLAAHRDCLATCGGYETIDRHDRGIAKFVVADGVTDVTAELLRGAGRSHMCAYLFRTEALRQLGGCREWFTTSEDADLQFRLAELGKVVYDPFVAYRYRLHDSSITHSDASASKAWYAQQAAEFLKQRRSTGADDLMKGQPPTFDPATVTATAAQTGASQNIQEQLIAEAWRLHRAGEIRAARRTGWRAVAAGPASWRAWKSAAALWLKRSLKSASASRE